MRLLFASFFGSDMRKHSLYGALLLALSLPALAERADAKKETQIQAQKASYNSVRDAGRFTGDIVMTRGSLNMRGEQLDFTQNANGYQEFVLVGTEKRRANFRQKSDNGDDEWIEGEGDRIEYSDQKEIMKIIGHARLRRLEGTRVIEQVEGEQVEYDSLKEMFHALSPDKPATSSDSRVTVVIQPREEKAGKNGKDGDKSAAAASSQAAEKSKGK